MEAVIDHRFIEMPERNVVILSKVLQWRDEMRALILGLPCVTEARALPHCSGVYFLVDNRGEILYVGQSVDLNQRWKARRDFGITTTQRVYYMVYDSMLWDINAMEGFMIFLFAPRYNRNVNNPVKFNSWDKFRYCLERFGARINKQ